MTTAELTERKKLKNTAEKTERENSFNEITENVSDPGKCFHSSYLNMKNSRGCERKAAKKTSELATYSKETLSSPPSSSFKHYAAKVRSLKKVENAFPNTG